MHSTSSSRDCPCIDLLQNPTSIEGSHMIATEINIQLCKHIFTLLYIKLSLWTSLFAVQAHDDCMQAWCVWLPWSSRPVCTIKWQTLPSNMAALGPLYRLFARVSNCKHTWKNSPQHIWEVDTKRITDKQHWKQANMKTTANWHQSSCL